MTVCSLLFQGPTGYKGEPGEVGKDGEKVEAGRGVVKSEVPCGSGLNWT